MSYDASGATLSKRKQHSYPREWGVGHDREGSALDTPRSSSPSRWTGRRDNHDAEERPPDTLNIDDSRFLSSHHYPSDSGYHSSGALSDGPNGTIQVSMDHGFHYNMSSMRSVGSVGSHGSSERERYSGGGGTHGGGGGSHPPPQRQFSWGALPPGRAMGATSYIVIGETRFPTAMSYAGSEAAKSDIATVCSGSVVEDIECSSVLSGDMNTLQTPTVERAGAIGGGSASSHRNSGGDAAQQTTPRSVEFALSRQHSSSSIGQRHQLQQLLPLASARASPPLQPVAPTIATLNDMGPPLSRSLLLQQHPSGHLGGGVVGGTSSRPESVRSFGSQRSLASSDVVAQVDTDDCGGSLAESDEDDVGGFDGEEKKSEDESGGTSTNPLLQNGMNSTNTNGRTSPGGTVYKGRGVRRYQGRYMNLPLKRFHQNGVTMAGNEDSDERFEYDRHHNDGYHSRDHYRSSYDRSSPRWGVENGRNQRQRSRSRSPPPPLDWGCNGYHRTRSWSRSRSGSQSPPRGRQNGRRNPRRRGSNGWNEHNAGTARDFNGWKRPPGGGRGQNGWSNHRGENTPKNRSPSRPSRNGINRRNGNGSRNKGRPYRSEDRS